MDLHPLNKVPDSDGTSTLVLHSQSRLDDRLLDHLADIFTRAKENSWRTSHGEEITDVTRRGKFLLLSFLMPPGSF